MFLREFSTGGMATAGGVTFGSAFSGELLVSVIGLVIMTIFGVVGLYLKWRDSKAIQQALKDGDLKEALNIRLKLGGKTCGTK